MSGSKMAEVSSQADGSVAISETEQPAEEVFPPKAEEPVLAEEAPEELIKSDRQLFF